MVSPRFLYQASLMEKRYLAMQIRSCEDKLKGKTAHFRLPCASQKRVCLSSLMIEQQLPPTLFAVTAFLSLSVCYYSVKRLISQET